MTTISLHKIKTFPNLPVLDPFADAAQIERAIHAGGYVASDETLDGLVNGVHGCAEEDPERWDGME